VKKYEVTVYEETKFTVIVEAEDKESAREQVNSMAAFDEAHHTIQFHSFDICEATEVKE